ncbi:MAG: hypothetical protein KDD11_22290 [Acidobacteria bacterium]|nr:hypothetical protein [Acidobacteriota bacterium]
MKNVDDLYPLSPLQASLLQHHLSAPHSGVGFEQSTATLRGDIDPKAFEAAWRSLVARHPILRTCFLSEGLEKPVQLVRRDVDLAVETRDWRGRSPAEQEELLDALLAEDRARGFDVRRAPLMRVALVRRAEDRFQFVWSYQHLLLDGWCRGLVMEDLFELYDAAAEGRAPQLPRRRPYRDYIAWLKGRDVEAGESFWRERLAGLAGATPLPLDRAGSVADDAAASEVDGWVDAFLDASEVADLGTFATRHGLTRATLLQGAWASVLGAAAGLDDVVYGTTVSGRPTDLPGSDAMLGMFINNLPVRVAWDPDEDVAAWLSRLQRDLVALRSFEHSAAEDLRRAAGLAFGRRLFDSLVLIQNYPVGDVGGQLGARSLSVESFRFRLETAYPLTVVVAPADGLQLRLHFDGRRYDRATAAAVLAAYRRTLLDLPSGRELPEIRARAMEELAVVEPPVTATAGGKAPRRWIAGELVDPALVARRLADLPPVTGAVARWRPDGAGGDLVLVALAVAPGAGSDALLRRLRRRLPPAAMPVALGLLEALPRLEDGTLDEAELAARADEALALAVVASAGTGAASSVDPSLARMAQLWSEVLGLPQSALTGDFFELGGHSLSAIQLLSRVRESFAVELPARALFEQPTLAAMTRLVASAAGTAPSTPVEIVDRTGELPLSFAQERLWFMHQLEPESAAYNSPRALWLEGPLEAAALAAALRQLVVRHESLRTRFPSDDLDRPQQVIDEAVPAPIPCLDLGSLAVAAREPEALARILARARRPFSLARGPLFRALLVRLEPRRHALLVELHHIVSDGWSMNVLVGEMVALYRASVAGDSSPLPPLPVQYADFAAWQKAEPMQRALEAQREYWRRHLAALPEEPLFALDHPRGEARRFRGADVYAQLETGVSGALERLGRREGATLFMTLLTVFAALAHRLTGATDIAVGTDVAGRERAELEGLIGFFVNNLVLRIDASGNPTFRQLVHRVREVVLDAFAHQQVPFDRVVQDLGVRRDPARTPLFQVLFVLQNTPRSIVDPGELTLRPLEVEAAVSKFDLAIFFRESPGGLSSKWTYDTDLFEARTVERLVGRYEHLVGQVVTGPDLPLSQLDLEASSSSQPRRSAERLRARRRRSAG